MNDTSSQQKQDGPYTAATGQERFYAISILLTMIVAIAYLVYWFLVLPHVEVNQQLEQVGLRYQQALKLESRREQLQKQLQKWQKSEENNQSLLLPQDNFDLAAAAIQERLRNLVDFYSAGRSSCGIEQRKNIVSDSDEGFIPVTVYVKLRCPLELAQAILYDLEVEKPILTINNLVMITLRNNTSELDVRFDITGYIRDNGLTESKPERVNR